MGFTEQTFLWNRLPAGGNSAGFVRLVTLEHPSTGSAAKLFGLYYTNYNLRIKDFLASSDNNQSVSAKSASARFLSSCLLSYGFHSDPISSETSACIDDAVLPGAPR